MRNAVFQQLSAIHEEYHRVKCGLEGQTSSIQQSLNIIENGLVQIVTKLVVLSLLLLNNMMCYIFKIPSLVMSPA